MGNRYDKYMEDLPTLCEEVHLEPGELTFNDIVFLVSSWRCTGCSCIHPGLRA